MKKKLISTEELERRFDEGEDILKYMDMSSARRPGLETKRVNVDFANWMVDRLDREARRIGVPRQSIIKVWIADRIKQEYLDRISIDSKNIQK